MPLDATGQGPQEREMTEQTPNYDVVVIGAGFGGLAAALRLSSRGARVLLCETLKYPGGCASTFSRRGSRFEAGATLFSGFDPGQLFGDWIAEYGLDVRFERMDPVVELRAPGLQLPIPPDRERFIELLAKVTGRPQQVTAFFREQARVAAALWELFDDPALLPPFGPAELLRHGARAPKYLPLLRHLNRTLEPMLQRHGLADCAPLRTYLDAVCQITVQASSREVEAPFALGAMDYYFRGTGHIHGGIGELAWALTRAVERQGGEVWLSSQVKALQRQGDGWRIDTRRGSATARTVIANLLPQSVLRLTGSHPGEAPDLERLAKRVEGGWGAVMLYLTLRADALQRPGAHHLELVHESAQPFVEGNHVFCSVSGASENKAPAGRRTVTVSTHLELEPFLRLSDADQAARIEAIQRSMRSTIAARAPELEAAIETAMPGSPRTFERFTGRDHGYVGGIPRRAGLANYSGLWPTPALPNLYLVGDSVFPGQSTLATALGGLKVADHIATQASLAAPTLASAPRASPSEQPDRATTSPRRATPPA